MQLLCKFDGAPAASTSAEQHANTPDYIYQNTLYSLLSVIFTPMFFGRRGHCNLRHAHLHAICRSSPVFILSPPQCDCRYSILVHCQAQHSSRRRTFLRPGLRLVERSALHLIYGRWLSSLLYRRLRTKCFQIRACLRCRSGSARKKSLPALAALLKENDFHTSAFEKLKGGLYDVPVQKKHRRPV